MNGTGEPIDALLAAEEEAAQARDGAAGAADGGAAAGAGRTPVQNIIVQFVSADDGAACGPQIELPVTTTVPQMQTLVNKLLENVCVVFFFFSLVMMMIHEAKKHTKNTKTQKKTPQNRKRQFHIRFM